METADTEIKSDISTLDHSTASTVKTDTVEVWYRNLFKCVQQFVDLRVQNILVNDFDIYRRRVDISSYLSLHYGDNFQYRCMIVDFAAGFTQEVRQGFTRETPYAVYPTWKYGDDLEFLEDLMANPVGQNEDFCLNLNIPTRHRPVYNQEHRIFLADIPGSLTGPGKAIINEFSRLQEEYPECILHILNVISYRVHFGSNFKVGLCDPFAKAAGKEVRLPSGSAVDHTVLYDNPFWAEVLGFTPDELEDRPGRIKFNIKSAEWAAKYFKRDIKFSVKPVKIKDKYDPSQVHQYKRKFAIVKNAKENKEVLETDGRIFTKNNLKIQGGDKFHCDTCTLMLACKLFRKGAVCAVPGTEPENLIKLFSTRDSEKIIDGLVVLQQVNASRLQEGMAKEEQTGELNSYVSDIIKTLFSQGEKLAKLVNPALRGGPAVSVNIGNSAATQINFGNPKQLVAQVINELESKGVSREDITPELIQGFLQRINATENPQQDLRTIPGQLTS